jgi:hypothetical protein
LNEDPDFFFWGEGFRHKEKEKNMSTRALMMVANEKYIPAFKLGSPQDLWKRLRSHSRGVVLFRHFDADPERVKKDIEKGLEFAQKVPYFAVDEGIVGIVSSCIISATMKVMPVQTTWCPLQDEEVDQISPVFHYLLILNPDNQKCHFYWWKLEEEEFGQHTWDFQPDPRLRNSYPDLMDKNFYDVLEGFIYGKLT